jgi:D-alanine-D-alanine ligase
MRKKVLVLRGGPSSEYEVSLKTGKSVIGQLADDYDVTDIVIDKNGEWISGGMIVKPEIVCRNVDCVFNAMHGEYGEDGQIQEILESLQVPFTGPKRMGATISMNKVATKDIYKRHGIKTPLHKVLTKPDSESVEAGIEVQAMLVFRTFPMPVIIKPVGLGSSVGITIAKNYEQLSNAMKNAYNDHDQIMVEEYIEGREATVGVVDNFRGKKVYALLPVEIRIPEEYEFFNYDAKYSGKTEEISPGNFNKKESEAMQEIAALAHEALGLRHYSRSDFIIHPRRGIYILETNSLPGLTEESLLPKSFEPIGSNYKEFLNHIIGLVLGENSA